MALRVGAAEVVITPPVGVELAGYGFGPSVGILDDLKAQALVVANGDVELALVTIDLLMLGPAVVNAVRQRLVDELGLPPEHITLSASHSHSAPTAMPLRQWGRVDEAYVRTLVAQLIGAVTMAWRNAISARLGWSVGYVRSVSENRRHGESLYAARDTIDPAVPVLRFDSAASGKPLAVLTNFACHPVTLHGYRNLLSPDYPGYLRSVVRDVLGRKVVTMFTLGAAGDINPAGYIPGETRPSRSRQIGSILGCEIAKVALEPQMVAQDPVMRAVQRVVDLPVAPLPSADELRAMRDASAAEAEELAGAGRPQVDVAVVEIQRDWAAEALVAVESGATLKHVPCELTAVRLGPVALLACPLEMFVTTGLAIKDASSAGLTLLSTNSNGAIGYLPTADAYERSDYANPEDLMPKALGVYTLDRRAEPTIREAAVDLLRELF